MALYCGKCGRQLDEDARFCSYCGSPVGIPMSGALGVNPPGLYRPLAGRKIAGVCLGLANHFGWDPVLVRSIAVIVSLLTVVLGVVTYLVLWFVIPEEPFDISDLTRAKP